MDILDTDTLVQFLTNADDPVYHDHKRRSQPWVGTLDFQSFILVLLRNPSRISKFFCF
jgi:hypothetical protein